MTRTGLTKAAIVLRSLPKQQAAQIVAKLDPQEISSVLRELERLDPVETKEIEQTLEILRDAAARLESQNRSHLRSTPDKLTEGNSQPVIPQYGRRKTDHVAEQTNYARRKSDVQPRRHFDFLEEVVPSICVALLREEHPRNIAIVLSWLPPEKSADILNSLESATRVSVLRRMCETEGTGNENEITELQFALKMRLKKLLNEEQYNTRGINVAASLLSCTDDDTQEKLLTYLNQSDPELAQELEHAVFHIHDLEQMENRDVKTLLQHTDTACWAPALRMESLPTRQKVLQNMGSHPALLLSQEISNLTNLDQITAFHARRQIINTALQLRQLGKIELPNLVAESSQAQLKPESQIDPTRREYPINPPNA